MSEGHVCQSCGKFYRLTLQVDAGIWRTIAPPKLLPEGQFLCPACILQRIQFNWPDIACMQLTQVDPS